MTRLRPVEARDIEQLRLWRNDPALNLAFRTVIPLSEHAQIGWFERISQPTPPDIMFAIEADARLVGCAGLCYVDWIHRNAEVSLYLGDDKAPPETGRDACTFLREFAFQRLGLHKLYCEVFDREDWRIRYFKLMGMREVGRYTQHRWVNGEWVDSVLMEILNE